MRSGLRPVDRRIAASLRSPAVAAAPSHMDSPIGRRYYWCWLPGHQLAQSLSDYEALLETGSGSQGPPTRDRTSNEFVAGPFSTLKVVIEIESSCFIPQITIDQFLSSRRRALPIGRISRSA